MDPFESLLPIYLTSTISHPHDDDADCFNDHSDPTPLETFSRTLRNYVPSSIPIPSAAPSPPRVSRPVSFGSFLNPTAPTATSPTASSPNSAEWRRRPSDGPPGRQHRTSTEMPVFSLDDDVPRDEDGDRRTTRYPGVGDTEAIVWAGWDVLTNTVDGNGGPPKPRCVRAPSAAPRNVLLLTGSPVPSRAFSCTPRSVLMLGYPTGLQLWDCSNLGSVSELLNLAGPGWGAVGFSGVLPDPPSGAEDIYRQKRPMVGFS